MDNEFGRAIENQQGAADKYITGTDAGATTLAVYEQTVKVTPPSSGTHTVTLPPVAQARGNTYDIETPTDATGTCTIAATGISNIVLTAAADHAVLWSNGEKYRVLAEVST